jgi:formylglycine-generating enzyme required for sulfatase activity
MTAANLTASHVNASLRLWGGLGVAAVIIGAALFFTRGPTPIPPPEMAAAAVIQPGKAALYVQKYEVTLAEWAACYDAGGCNLSLRTPAGKDPATTPATGLSFVDAREYVAWINGATRHTFRLPTVVEWEFMAVDVLPEHPDPIFTSPDLTWASSYLIAPQTKRTLRPQGTFSSSAQGIADLDGSVWEWTSDCYAGVADGIMDVDHCPAFFVAGEHMAAIPFLERDPARGGCAVGAPPAHLGMRLVTDDAV